MKIGIIGNKGIPNEYGGFEQLAEKLSVGLVQKANEVVVYNCTGILTARKNFHGVQIVHCFDAEIWLEPRDGLFTISIVWWMPQTGFWCAVVLGYTSSSYAGKIIPGNMRIIISNMDGFEWNGKYSKPVKALLRYMKKLAVKYSHYFVADSIAMHAYLKINMGKTSLYCLRRWSVHQRKEELLASITWAEVKLFYADGPHGAGE